ncbi:alanine--glyoxylate aminotransferase family protein [Aminivibrio sp.]|jgi:aspartate aminotransferase-like enzyme|uniref:pyridoxal-phosphate-dependent aminotransferase family protein n=1 Tax=Aminivibrio sp. TaxID=1872489 RepID=UPI001A4FEEA6|nr:alanine--glyoxylate aminotransferase family protein [Aminivibrio sp.]MBL3540145.1 alanine--glyoxylate aminotransferase family protein [Aminivibrio sp.]MDK2959711.1 alanine-glyoxylate transaminase / serine-glyoxylate transaminase / serine-pyruvate transaminase [Synergistaceae bacterium]
MIKTNKLVMIPGPTPVVRSIQDQMGRETVAFGDTAFVKDFSEVIADLKAMWRCDGEVFVVAGSGTMGMEMAIANTTKRGDNVLICSNGYFGDRFIDMCTRKGLNTDVLSAEWGTSVTPEMVEKKLAEKQYQAVTVTHVETSTGVEAPIAAIGEVMKKHPEIVYIVDGVAASGGADQYMDTMGIDVVLSCSQKAFGVAPGLTMVWASAKAMERRKSLGTIPESYIDFDKWLPVMHDPSKYWGTPAINLVWALKESVRIMKEEGLEERYARHRRQAAVFDAALEAIGFRVAADKAFRAPTLSVYLYPEGSGIDDVKFRTVLAGEGAQTAGCLGGFAGKGFRMGHMGNIDKHTLVSAIAAVERSCVKCGYTIELGKALGVLQKGLVNE